MAKYRTSLPLMKGGTFLSDGGMETSLIFTQGIDLPQFASFPLLKDAAGRAALTRYYENFLAVARNKGLGFVLDTATWRASRDWGAKLGYDAAALAEANRAAVELISGLRLKWESPTTPQILNGVIGPRGDGYKGGSMNWTEAQDFHAFQAEIFAKTEADMISAITMNTIGEAAGIALAAKASAMPCVVAFTVETDGKLVGGETLQRAIETVDAVTGGSPLYYMINCAHPSHFQTVLDRDAPWLARVQGVRANASAKSHAELDESTALDEGDIADLARRYRALGGVLPKMRVIGGCCGTDHHHIAAICEAVMPAKAA
ncbi:MAG: homocysteine S-methyltransferase family protein [Rhizobiaceae bacterium]